MVTVKANLRTSFEKVLFPNLDTLWTAACWLTMRNSLAERLVLATVSRAYGSWNQLVRDTADHKASLLKIMVRNFFETDSKRRRTRRYQKTFSRVAENANIACLRQTPRAPLDERELRLLSEISETSVKAALFRLRPRGRLIMMLHYRERMPSADIAYITDLHVDSVSAALMRLSRLIPRYLVNQHRRRLLLSDRTKSAMDASNESWENEGGSTTDEYQEQAR